MKTLRKRTTGNSNSNSNSKRTITSRKTKRAAATFPVGSSILPVTVKNGKLMFLFGKECEKEDSAHGFSDFGGGVEKGESILDTAIREGAEELTGFLGNPEQIRTKIDLQGGLHKIRMPNYHAHLFYLPYNAQLPLFYNQNHRFLWDRMDTQLLNKTKLFEKIEVEWFSVQDMKERMFEFRSFYQKMVRRLIKKESEIKQFVNRAARKTKKGRK